MMITYFIVFYLFIFGVSSVDQNNFKTCDRSGFCKRLKAFNPSRSGYELITDSVQVDKSVLTASVKFINPEDNSIVWHYILKLTALEDSTFRVELDEAEPLYPKYRPQLALKGEPKIDSLKILSKRTDAVTLTNSQGHKVLITASPLKLEFLDRNGHVAVVLNKNSKLLMEPLISRQNEDENAVQYITESFGTHHDSKLRGNESISLDIFFPEAEAVYGIPEHTDGLALKNTVDGEPYRLYNLDVFEYELNSRMAIYGSVPVVYAHGQKRTTGVFWHNAAETWVDITNPSDKNVIARVVEYLKDSPDPGVTTRFMSEAGVLDMFVFLGDMPSDVFRQYTALTGVAPLPPKFSLAYHQCRWNYMSRDEVIEVNEAFDKHNIPADVIWLDIEYTDNKKYFTWDPQRFKEPETMVANLTALGRKLVVIIDPHIKRDDFYFLHRDATDKGYYVKNKDGNDYEGWCWPGSSSYLDFFNPEVSKYYSERYSNFEGTSRDVHIWNDMNEPSVFSGPEITMPKDCRHYRTPDGKEGIASYWEHRHVHNEYGLWQVKATYEGMLMRDHNESRPFILTRSTFSGTQRYAAVWTGDNAAEFGFLAASVPMCLSLAISGISFCGSDVGGFFKNTAPELMTRWYQAGAYQPFFRAHAHLDTRRREPWKYEADVLERIKQALRRRYELLDFWYTLFYEHTRDGLPVMRPLFQEYPKDTNTYTIDDQYLLGDKLLVRPIVEEGATSVTVYLPGADTLWYESDLTIAHRGGSDMTREVTIDTIPVYQRGGTIVPRKMRVRRSSKLMADDPYTLYVAVDANYTSVGSLYIDDGETYNYTSHNKYIYAKLAYEPAVMTYSFVENNTHNITKSWVEKIYIAGVKTPKTATLHQNGDRILEILQENGLVVVRKPDAKMNKPWRITFTY